MSSAFGQLWDYNFQSSGFSQEASALHRCAARSQRPRERDHATAARNEEKVRTERADQKRQREMLRLEVELREIPIEAASDEDHDARQSWELLQQSQLASESRARLELLKEARRLLPKEYRPERF